MHVQRDNAGFEACARGNINIIGISMLAAERLIGIRKATESLFAVSQ